MAPGTGYLKGRENGTISNFPGDLAPGSLHHLSGICCNFSPAQVVTNKTLLVVL